MQPFQEGLVNLPDGCLFPFGIVAKGTLQPVAVVDEVVYAGFQQISTERFGQIGVCATLIALYLLFFLAVGCEHDDGDVRCL